MHDPEVVAFDIYRPWPSRHRSLKKNPPRWYWRPPFVTVAGREFYFPPMVIVWHNEPGGHDALTICDRKSHWRWHIHHWHLQFPPLQAFRRWALTRCEWCGGRSLKRDQVNHALGWYSEKAPWWRGERGLYHSDCTSVELAHRLCLCDNPGLSNGDHGQCAFCGKHRAWRQVPTIPDRYLASLPSGSRIPDDKREWLRAEWAKVRAEREARESDA